MQASDKQNFLKMLTQTLGAYGKPLPADAGIIAAWWAILEPFPLAVVSGALAAYTDENGEFPPVPAGIKKRCRMMDGRPSDEEAWAIALTSRDEASTVVWTAEAAEAFAICSPVLDMGDEVGARMAFRDAYNRLVTEARSVGRPAQWNASLGWDIRGREAVVAKAVTAGLLDGPKAHALLPNYVAGEAKAPGACPEGLTRLKEELAKMQAKRIEDGERYQAELIAQREAEAAKKVQISEQVAAYNSQVTT